MEKELWFTHILNSVLAKPVTALLLALHVHVADPAHPIPDYLAMEILVVLVLMAFALWLGRKLSVTTPTRWQHMIEWTWEGVGQQAEEVIGHGSYRFLPLLMTLTLFILAANLLGLFPRFEAPTANIRVTLGCSLIAIIYYHAIGIRQHGLGYLRQFVGPVWWLALLMIPIEIVSHLARLMSLSVRLYANMFAGDMVTTIMLALLPISGLIFMGLHVFVALLQTYIFVLLTMVYLAGAVAEEH